ncbi:DinB family protein [Terriglobus saanensis]|uniref:DinB-like domain-containing protein n=1 Tax=Terriglobus saanensis (strain ATCC BAA-1853 / DSM 23119 / SP1PR4) TaxID=401053 RepID=E8V0V2_TERSS|nr:DinB family protein [Terriglobus saanensis]ADV82243.1 hypothetical protein AciPR4_1420 [Terriglobus saanensis SP1PR4]
MATTTSTPDLTSELRKQLLALLKGGQAHATFEDAIRDLPADLRGKTPEGLPYSPWQILEHLRITQRDILDFSTNQEGNYKELDWPKDYWPKTAVPTSEDVWKQSISAFSHDLKAFEALVKNEDLTEPFSWDGSKNLLREALLLADHTAYHLGELIVIRRLLGAWKK